MNSSEDPQPATTDELDLPWSYPWQDPDSIVWRMVAVSSDTGTVRSGGHDDHHDPAQAGEGAPKMSTTRNDALDYALRLAASLEETLTPGDVEDEEFLEGILEMVADTHGALRVVLTLGGPRAELVLGDGAPRVEVWWGADHHACSANIDEGFVDDFLDTWWRPTMEAALTD